MVLVFLLCIISLSFCASSNARNSCIVPRAEGCIPTLWNDIVCMERMLGLLGTLFMLLFPEPLGGRAPVLSLSQASRGICCAPGRGRYKPKSPLCRVFLVVTSYIPTAYPHNSGARFSSLFCEPRTMTAAAEYTPMEEGDEVLIDFDESEFDESEDFFAVEGEEENDEDEEEDDSTR